MSWGKDLWDQFNNLALHTQKGIDFLDRYGSFLKDRCQAEQEYAKNLRSIAKKYQPKRKEEDDYQFTYSQAFLGVLSELIDVAGQHEVIAENLRDHALSSIATTSRDLKEHRKTHLSEATRLQQELDSSIDLLNRVKKDYGKAFKEAEAAHAKFAKADADMNLSRAEVEKTKQLSIVRAQQAEECKNSYALQLQRTNELQQQHYKQALPTVLEKLRDMDEARIQHVQQLIRQCVDIERKVLPIVQKCLDGMLEQAQRVNAKQDSLLVVERYRTGYLPPEDIPFVDLSQGGSLDVELVNGHNHANSGTITSPSPGGTFSRSDGRGSTIGRNKSKRKIKDLFRGSKQTDEPKDDFSDLPPSQRCKRLQQRLDTIAAELHQKTASRDGLLKMQKVYEQNPNLGDLSQVQQQLVRNTEEIEYLQAEMEKYRSFMSEAQAQLNVPINQASALGVPPPPLHTSPGGVTRSSLSDQDSLSRSASESSVSHTNTPQQRKLLLGGAGARPQPTTTSKTISATSNCSNSSSASPESGIADAVGRISFADSDPDGVYNECDYVPLGTCHALYSFEATADGTISIKEGETMILIELDEGDGWTRVRKDSHQEGFVPSAYLDIKPYPKC